MIYAGCLKTLETSQPEDGWGYRGWRWWRGHGGLWVRAAFKGYSFVEMETFAFTSYFHFDCWS